MTRNYVVDNEPKPEIKEPPTGQDVIEDVPESEDIIEDDDDDDDDDDVSEDNDEDA